jgi:hypothetical protein
VEYAVATKVNSLRQAWCALIYGVLRAQKNMVEVEKIRSSELMFRDNLASIAHIG